MKSYKNWQNSLIEFLVTFLVFLITFPKFEPYFGTGLDLSYTWAFNHLIHHDYNVLTSLIYPIGPFGFLKYVAAYENNLLIGLVCFSLIKLSLIYFLLKLSYASKGKHSVINVLLIIVAAYFSNFDFSIIGSTVVLLLLFNQKPSRYYLFLVANFFALFGLFVKSSIGITAYSAIFSYLVFVVLSGSMKLKYAVTLTTSSLLIFLLSGSFVFNGLWPFLNFLNGIIHLAGGYSSGLALYPENNWWLLGGFIISILIVPFALKEKSARLGFVVLLLPFFAMWKHAIGREDIYHIQILIGFTILFWAILYVVSKKKTVWFIILPLAALSLFYVNMANVPLFKSYRINTSGFSNFNKTILHYTSFNKNYKTISEKAIQSQVFTSDILKEIGHNTVDIYPWELSYIPANNLNWKPRKTIELGASTSSWLARKSAEHYTGNEAPEFLVFQSIDDKWGGKFGSLDGRYILNDEPQLIFNLIQNYKLKRTAEDFLLFSQSKDAGNLIIKPLIKEKGNWNEWINVPKTEQGIVRAEFACRKNLLGRIKTALYKDEAYYIDYQLAAGKVISYRFLPSNAADGLWINPLIINTMGPGLKSKVERIRFRCSNQHIVANNLDLNWINIFFAGNGADQLFFEKFDSIKLNELFRFDEHFETKAKLIRSDSLSYSGNFSEIVGTNQFSTSLIISLDPVWGKGTESVTIEASVMYHANNKKRTKAMLVLSLQDSENDFWKVFPFAENMIDDEWNYAFLRKGLDVQKHKSGILKVYVWNKGEEEVLIDDLTLVGYRNNR